MKAVHLRYLADDLRAVPGVGVFQQGTVALVPGPVAAQLIASGDFELVTTGPLAKVLVLRIGQDTILSPDAAPLTRAESDGAAAFEAELEEAERNYDAIAADRDRRQPGSASAARTGLRLVGPGDDAQLVSRTSPVPGRPRSPQLPTGQPGGPRQGGPALNQADGGGATVGPSSSRDGAGFNRTGTTEAIDEYVR